MLNYVSLQISDHDLWPGDIVQHQELDAAASLLAGDNGGLRERRGVIQSVNDMSRTCVVHWFSLQQLADRHGADWAVGSVVEENVSLYDVQPVTSEGKILQFLVGDCVMWTGSVAATLQVSILTSESSLTLFFSSRYSRWMVDLLVSGSRMSCPINMWMRPCCTTPPR